MRVIPLVMFLALGCGGRSTTPSGDGGARIDAGARTDGGARTDAGSTTGECRARDECAPGESCFPPGVPNCGVACPMDSTCVTDADCPKGAVCADEHGDGCCEGIAIEVCLPACTPGSCRPDFRCNAGGGCEPIPCTDGYTCSTHTTCDVTSTDADRHGCARDRCTSDAECGTGACVFGFCYSGPGTCMPPAP